MNTTSKPLFFLISLFVACQNTNEPYLKSFKNYELEEPIDELERMLYELVMYDSLYINVEQTSHSTIVKSYHYGNGGEFLPYWEGSFRINKDSIFLNVAYIKAKDPHPDLSSFAMGTVVHHYEFSKIDTSKYRFYSDWFVPVDERVYLGDQEEEEGKDE